MKYWIRKLICPKCDIEFKISRLLFQHKWEMSGTMHCPNGCLIQFKEYIEMLTTAKLHYIDIEADTREWEHRLGLVMIRELQAQLAHAERSEEDWEKEEKGWRAAIDDGVLINAKRWQDIQDKNDEIIKLRQHIRELESVEKNKT